MTSPSLPPTIMTSIEGSFAYNTIAKRKPGIVTQIITDNHYPPEIQQKLFAFQDELAHGNIQPPQEEDFDRDIWMEDLAPWLGKTWFEIPWLLAESYFYRRILAIVGYFKPGPGFKKDPFGSLKEKESLNSLGVFKNVYDEIPAGKTLEGFQGFCYKALWGNRSDLSTLKKYDVDMDTQADMIVINQTKEAFDFFLENPKKIAFFFDNTGRELFFDLAFIDYLLGHNLADKITGYMKDRPFFVSDVTPGDFENAVDHLMENSSDRGQCLAKELINAQKSGSLEIKAPPFFTHARDFRQMSSNLQKEISTHDLTILKGDLNFRKLMGDRHWPQTTPISEAAGYFPTSFLSLRTLKSDVMVGLPSEISSELQKHAEKDWLTNGKRGMILFHKR